MVGFVIQRQWFLGAIFSLVITLIAYGLSILFHLNLVMTSLVLGMIIGNIFKIPFAYQSGIQFTSVKLLEWSIIFLAFGVQLQHIGKIGGFSFLMIAFVILSILIFTYLLSQKLHCPGSTGWLIGFGTAICGSSAIAALSPLVSKDKNDVGISLAVVNLLGLLGMFLLPFFMKF